MSERPVACVGDGFACTCGSPRPHGTGVVMGKPGAAIALDAVLLESKPAAAKGDMTLCSAQFPGTVTGGSGTVFVHGKQIARQGDSMSHGAILPGGCPTVMVGMWRPSPVEVIHRGHVTITIDRHAHTITLVGEQDYYGTGATQAYVDAAIADINRVWSTSVFFQGDRYTVISRITGRVVARVGDVSPNATPILVVQTTWSQARTSSETKLATNQPYYAVTPGLQWSTDNDSGNTPAHEFGHSMGLPDGYLELKAPDGTRDTPCYNQGDVMCNPTPSDSRPTDTAIHDLVTGSHLAK